MTLMLKELFLLPLLSTPPACSSDRCVKILELARKYNLLVVCDDVYNLLYFPRKDGSVPQLKRLFAYEDKYVHPCIVSLPCPGAIPFPQERSQLRGKRDLKRLILQNLWAWDPPGMDGGAQKGQANHNNQVRDEG